MFILNEMVIVYSVEEPRTIEKDVHYKRKVHQRKVHYVTLSGKAKTKTMRCTSEGKLLAKTYKKHDGINNESEAKDMAKRVRSRLRYQKKHPYTAKRRLRQQGARRYVNEGRSDLEDD